MIRTQKPFFSVVIPVYNKEPHIARTINSVLNQTFKNFELIIVCDPSTDNSNKEVKKFIDSRIKIFYRDTPGQGGYAARNLGIKEANGKWIAFLDADDEWHPNHLLNIYGAIIKSDSKLFTTGWYDSYENDKIEEAAFIAQNKLKGIFKINFIDFINYSLRSATPIHTNTIVVKKELFEKVSLFPENICKRGGDVTTWLQLVKYTNELLCLPYITSIYHRENSTVTKELPAEINGNCIYITVKKLLENEHDKKRIIALKRFSNYHIRFGLIARVKIGTLKKSDINFHYYKVDPKLHILFIILSMMPKFFQITLFKILRKLKKR